MKTPITLCTYTPKKYLRFPSFCVANSDSILSITCCTNNSFEPIMIISSTYTRIYNVCSFLKMNRDGFDLLPMKLVDIKKLQTRLNHILRDYLISSSDFFNRHTKYRCWILMNPTCNDITILSSSSSLRNALNISSWYKLHPLETMMARTKHIENGLMMGLKVSW